ncbi:MAG: hypothetical protein IH586_02760, partial [Anaerolineaceae bacterium]|nr:hypothetical protein [Anaerolineaceae bacterium]
MLSALLLATIQRCLDPTAQIDAIAELDLDGHGYSGARLHRFRVRWLGGDGSAQTQELVVKEAQLVERQALDLLYRQGQVLIPFNHSPDLLTAGPAALCMEMIAGDNSPVGEEVLARTAQGLAALHLHNRANPERLTWAPAADRAYFESGYVLGTWRTAWAQSLADPDFTREYGPFSARLEAAAQHFLSVMEVWWAEGET